MIKNIKKLDVYYKNRIVGTIAENSRNQTVFKYDYSWLKKGFSISPFSLPLEDKLFLCTDNSFGYLFGVFSDSLPDGWGRLIMDRKLKSSGVKPEELTELTRLTLLGNDSAGGLTYKPNQTNGEIPSLEDINDFAAEVKRIEMNDEEYSDLELILSRGSSSGGARPKLNCYINNTLYLVKFPSSSDRTDSIEMEWEYMKTAAECGINTAETIYEKGKNYLLSRRFDRPDTMHMITLSGLLESSHRLPALDYNHLFKATAILTKSKEESEEVFRRMCFNVLAENMDDHGKNFAFIYTEERGWKLSPCYDLTYSHLPYGERSSSVNGKGKNITECDLITIGKQYALNEKWMKDEIDKIKTAITSRLSRWVSL